MAVVAGLDAWLDAADRIRRTARLQRERAALKPLSPVRVHDGSRDLLNFSGNDYLGLATHPALAEAAANALRDCGTGSGASAVVTGYRPEHRALEDAIADFLERESALLFSSGFMANLAVATSLAGRGDRIVQDRLCHASLIDAARLSGAKLARYRHLDIDSLRQQLQSVAERQLVVTDGVFSMDGDRAPLAEIAEVAGSAGAWLVVDDAHGIGVCGPGGRGCVAEAGLDTFSVPVLVGTLGKAFGSAGAFVAGSRALVEHLVNEARTYLFTTAIPPAQAAASLAGLRQLQREPWRREKLGELIVQLQQGARERGLPLSPSETPIQPLVLGDPEVALRMSDGLRELGFLVKAIRPPTVPLGTARLRIALSAAHEPGQVEALLSALEQCLALP